MFAEKLWALVQYSCGCPAILYQRNFQCCWSGHRRGRFGRLLVRVFFSSFLYGGSFRKPKEELWKRLKGRGGEVRMNVLFELGGVHWLCNLFLCSLGLCRGNVVSLMESRRAFPGEKDGRFVDFCNPPTGLCSPVVERA